jgi:acetolactate synthase-1/2/3 large subunit
VHVHEVIARTLRDFGVTTVFGLIGDGNLYMMDAYVRGYGGEFVAATHEASAVLAAHGYSRTTGRTGVATVTHGPALTNTVTALIEAVRSRTPLVLIAGDVAVADRDNLQKIDQRSVIAPTGAGFEQVRSPETLTEDFVMAFRRTELERRPIVLNVPADFQWMQTEFLPATPRPAVRQHVRPDRAAVDAALGVIASARRPLVLAGRGATSPEARDAVLRFARTIGAPVATTLQARELYDGEPENLGIFGTLSTDGAVGVIAQADCVIAFGASLNRWTTGEGGIVDGKAIVQVDREPAALNQWTAVAVPVVADVTSAADEFVEQLTDAEIAASDFAGHVPAGIARVRGPVVTDLVAGTVDINQVLAAIDLAFPAERSLVLDAGRFFHHAAFNLRTGAPNSYVHTLEFGCIGLGMANALGAAAGHPETPVLLVSGDGGFMLGGLGEFSTAVRNGMDIVVVVMNDRSYGAEHIQFRTKGLDPGLSMFDWPDLAQVATALGGAGFAVRSMDDLDVALKGVAARDRPVLIDVQLDPDRIFSPYH